MTLLLQLFSICPISNQQILAWHQTDDTPLSESKVIYFADEYMRDPASSSSIYDLLNWEIFPAWFKKVPLVCVFVSFKTNLAICFLAVKITPCIIYTK